ncbi:hypothetical protein N9195_01500 [bacterium]|nr:hypothetical protein [bacterium]
MSTNLPDRIYRDLSISQRVRAAWEAMNRNDISEFRRLTKPKEAGEYTIDRVSAALYDIQFIGMAAKIDLLNCVVRHLFELHRLEKTDDPEEETNLLHQIYAETGDAAAITAALEELADQIGLDGKSFLESLGPTHPIVQAQIDEFGEDACPDLTEQYCELLSSFLKKRHPQIPCFEPAKQDS